MTHKLIYLVARSRYKVGCAMYAKHEVTLSNLVHFNVSEGMAVKPLEMSLLLVVRKIQGNVQVTLVRSNTTKSRPA